MSSAFLAEQNYTNKTEQTRAPHRAADLHENSSELNRSMHERQVAPAKQAQALKSVALIHDNVVNLEGRTKAFMYIPVTLKNADEVWARVVKAIRCMDSADFSEVESGEDKSYDCYSLKYVTNTFVLARTRLVRLEEDGEQIYIELRKLDGDGFAFTDDFQRHLESELEDITKPDERPQPQAKPEAMFLDLAGGSREEIMANWLTNLRPVSSGSRLVYNEIETYTAISSLGWNASSPENFEVLKEYGSEIVECSLNILTSTEHLPTAYFAALTLNEFAKNGQMDADWSVIKMVSGAIVNWSEKTEDAGMQVSQSREVVRLLSNVILAVAPQLTEEGKAKAEGSVASMLETLQELSDNEDYEGCFDLATLGEALSM